MSVDVVPTDCAYLLLGDEDRLSADSMTRTNSRSSLADMVTLVTEGALCDGGRQCAHWNAAADTSRTNV